MPALVRQGPLHETPEPFTLTVDDGFVAWPDPMTTSMPFAANWLAHLAEEPMRGLLGPLDPPDQALLRRTLTVRGLKDLAGQVHAHYVDCWAPPQDLQRLVWFLDRFPGPVMLDLQPRGVDVRSWVAQRRWRDLLVMIDGLPDACAISEALAEDPQWVAEQVAAESESGVVAGGGTWKPRPREYDLTAALLADLSARIEHLRVAVVRGYAKHPESVRPGRPFPAPRTLLDLAREQQISAEVEELYEMFQPAQAHAQHDSQEFPHVRDDDQDRYGGQQEAQDQDDAGDPPR